MASRLAKVEVTSLADLAVGRVDLATALLTCADPRCTCDVYADRVGFRDVDRELTAWLYGACPRGVA